MNFLERFAIYWNDYKFLAATLGLVLWVFLVRYVVQHFQEMMMRFTHRPGSAANEAFTHTASIPAGIALFLVGIWLFSEISGMGSPALVWVREGTVFGLLLLVTFFVFRFTDEMVHLQTDQYNKSSSLIHMAGWITKGAALTLFVLIVLELAGIPTTSVMIVLAILLFVLGAYVFLTTQAKNKTANTGNVESQLNMSGDGGGIEKELATGAQIKLENGPEGTILEVGWQSTRIQNQEGGLLIVPNARVHQSLVRVTRVAPTPTEEKVPAAWN